MSTPIVHHLTVAVAMTPNGPELIGPVQSGTVHHIDVVIDQGGRVLAPCRHHKVDGAARGDKIWWHFYNRSERTMKLGIGKFARHPRATCTVPRDHGRHMREAVDLRFLGFPSRQITVGAGRDRFLEATISRNTLFPRTYKYAILGNGRVLLDPEVEIEKP